MMIYSHYGKKIVLASLGILRVGKRKLGGFLNEENKENGTSIKSTCSSPFHFFWFQVTVNTAVPIDLMESLLDFKEQTFNTKIRQKVFSMLLI